VRHERRNRKHGLLKRPLSLSLSPSLSRAARALRKFVEVDTAAKPDTAAYLRRTVAAFNVLLEFHDKIERGEDENSGNEEIEERK
jgi:hypothetical protein